MLMRFMCPVLVASLAILGAGSCQRANRANHIAQTRSAAPTNEALPEVPDFLGVKVPNPIIYLTPGPTGPTLCAENGSGPDLIHVGCGAGQSKPEQLGRLRTRPKPVKSGRDSGTFPEGI
jgi:hypothetical protein